MARIRTIKPEFFHDEDVAALPVLDRLVYIGLWTQADKAGRLEDRPRRLKALILPYDDADFTAILDRLIAAQFVTRYAVNGHTYLHIRSWTKHQRPHHTEPESLLPPREDGEESPLPHRSTTVRQPLSDGEAPDGREGKGREGKGREKGVVSADADRPSVQAFIEAWHTETSKPIGRCLEVTPKRKTAILARLRDRPLEDWCAIFQRIEASAFCRGHNDRQWHADIDWVLRPDTAAKVLEGKYDDRGRGVGPPATAEDWCREHDPPCHTQQEHTRRLLADARQARQAVAS